MRREQQQQHVPGWATASGRLMRGVATAAAAAATHLEDSATSTASAAAAAAAPHKAISVSSMFDGGNIEVLKVDQASGAMQLAIRPDPFCESDKAHHMMWFNYRVRGARGRALAMDIVNAGEASYPTAWDGYQVAASYDLHKWFRVPTSYANGTLAVRHTPDADSVQYAFFAPYTTHQHDAFIARAQVSPLVTLEVLGQTPDGRDIELLRIGEMDAGVGAAAARAPGAAADDGGAGAHVPAPAAPHKLAVWLTHRQHPGETQAEYFAEGLIERLAAARGSHDAVARALLARCVFYVMPNMCPDGSARGHLRCNARGRNLNREWREPCAENSPEVFYTLKKMRETGVDFFMDVHGEEELPHVFVAGNQAIPRFGPRLQQLQDSFSDAFKRASPEFQTKYGYPYAPAGKANLSLASKAVGQEFDCLALTLEMPFKDSAELPEPVHGYTPDRCRGLGAAFLTALLEVVPSLR